MKMAKTSSSRSVHQRYVVAMVLGTALSALGAAPATAGEGHTAERAVADMSRYCTACWRNAHLHPDCWTDCTQEVFSRLLERVTPTTWDQVLKVEGQERREFLRAIDTVKKRSQRSRKWSPISVNEVADRRDAQERQLADDRHAVWQAAEVLVSPRQQQILKLSSTGWSVQEIAEEMNLPPERVSDEKYKAIRKLREYFVTPSATEEC